MHIQSLVPSILFYFWRGKEGLVCDRVSVCIVAIRLSFSSYVSLAHRNLFIFLSISQEDGVFNQHRCVFERDRFCLIQSEH